MLQLTTVLFLIAGSMLAVLHIISLKLFLYWRFFWLDIPMHALGGTVVALGLFTFYDLRLVRSKRWLKPVSVVLFVLGVALLWEVYELLIGVPIESNYLFDTGLDIIMGLTGGALGAFVGQRIRKLG